MTGSMDFGFGWRVKSSIYKERHMNKVLFETAYMGDIRGIMLTVLGFGGLLLLYLKIKSDAKT